MRSDSATYRLDDIFKGPWTFFEIIGRFVVDFGFGSLLDKFEEYFGRVATKGLVALVGLAVVAVCLNLIWEFTYPIIDWFTGTSAGIGVYGYLVRFGGLVIALVLLGGTASAVSDALLLHRTMNEAGAYLRMAIDEMERSAEVSDRLAEIVDMLNEAVPDDAVAEMGTDKFRELANSTRFTAERLRKLRSDFYGDD